MHTGKAVAPIQPNSAGSSQQTSIDSHEIRLVLLDIEGTTCPVSFVTGSLFPYAAAAMGPFLQGEAAQRQNVQDLVEAAQEAWHKDAHPAARHLLKEQPSDLAAYLCLLIQQDRKLPALKELQGLVWQAGYETGVLVAPLFDEVPEILRDWKEQGLRIAIYSSGSVKAQKLLYGHTTSGDLKPLIDEWFDTQVGAKEQSASYAAIAKRLQLATSEILFITDSAQECRAAQMAGMTVLFSDRDGNPKRDPQGFKQVSSLRQIAIKPGAGLSSPGSGIWD